MQKDRTIFYALGKMYTRKKWYETRSSSKKSSVQKKNVTKRVSLEFLVRIICATYSGAYLAEISNFQLR